MKWIEDRKVLKQKLQTMNLSTQEDYIFELYQYQYQNNSVYQRFVNLVKGHKFRPKDLADIPFLPISFFKSETVITGELDNPEKIFQSSGTTQNKRRSRHYVFDVKSYQEHSLRIFGMQYGKITNYHLLALLPGYQEREDSSLIAMVDNLIYASESELSGYYLGREDELIEILQEQTEESEKTILLIGVSFALLQLFRHHKLKLSKTIIIETGGMKGKGPEWTKEKLHDHLSEQTGVPFIHTEYGMTELLSQSYGIGNHLEANLYLVPSISDITDPLALKEIGESGLLRFIDLANIDSCAFIQTEDLGIIHENRTFSIIGRLDHAEIRGCNLLVSDLK